MTAQFTRRLPNTSDALFLTEAGIETTMMYKKGWELNHFCLFELLQHDRFVTDVRTYHTRIIEVALKYKIGHILDGLHYRASPDWGSLLGMSAQQLADLTAKGLDIYTDLSREYATEDTPIPVGCCIGPRGDAYDAKLVMTADQAEEYHSVQIETAKAAGADFVLARWPQPVTTRPSHDGRTCPAPASHRRFRSAADLRPGHKQRRRLQSARRCPSARQKMDWYESGSRRLFSMALFEHTNRTPRRNLLGDAA